MSRLLAVTAALSLAVGCSANRSSEVADGAVRQGVPEPFVDCTNYYAEVAAARSRGGLEKRLLRLNPRARSLRITVQEPGHGKTWVNLLGRQDQVIEPLAIWQQDDLSWTAQNWLHCVD
jgi:hypothetical protein